MLDLTSDNTDNATKDSMVDSTANCMDQMEQQVPFQRYQRRNSATKQMLMSMTGTPSPTTPLDNDNDNTLPYYRGDNGNYYPVNDMAQNEANQYGQYQPTSRQDEEDDGVVVSMKMSGDGSFRPVGKANSAGSSSSSTETTTTTADDNSSGRMKGTSTRRAVHNLSKPEQVHKDTGSALKKKPSRRSTFVGIGTKTISFFSRVKRRAIT